jgi:hypothetical protein
MLHRIRRVRELFMPGVFGLLVIITLVCVLAGCASSSAATADPGTGITTSVPSSHADDGIPMISVQELPPRHAPPSA